MMILMGRKDILLLIDIKREGNLWADYLRRVHILAMVSTIRKGVLNQPFTVISVVVTQDEDSIFELMMHILIFNMK